MQSCAKLLKAVGAQTHSPCLFSFSVPRLQGPCTREWDGELPELTHRKGVPRWAALRDAQGIPGIPPCCISHALSFAVSGLPGHAVREGVGLRCKMGDPLGISIISTLFFPPASVAGGIYFFGTMEKVSDVSPTSLRCLSACAKPGQYLSAGPSPL